MPELKCNPNLEQFKKLFAGQPSDLNADESDIRRFENKYRHTFFADTHHSSEENSDIRAVWEPARLQHATLMFLQASKAKDPENTKALSGAATKAVLDWIRQHPFLFGPHYLSAMECGLRVYSFFHCLKSCRDLPEQEIKEITDAIYFHGWWIYRRRSLYSSLGNHTICEAVGLVFAGAVYRKTTEGNRWLKEGVKLLRQELRHQILDDGGPAEQSLSYHRFVLDLYWLAKDFLEINKIHDLADFQTRLLKGEAFLNTLQDSVGRLPAIGDNDNGYAIAPGVAPLRHKGEKPAKDLTIFAKSGYTVLRGSRDLVFTLDHGPLGMAPLYNHGHADALSVTLNINGAQILIDPGTYRYNGVPEWRRYFKGTRAHNTVTVDGRDQANQETGFIWSRAYNARLIKHKQTDEGLYLQASHDGYTQPQNPVTHFRALAWFPDEGFIIKDRFEGTGDHEFEITYHIHPDTTINEEKGWWTAANPGVRVFMRLLPGDVFTSTSGQESPPFGWYSSEYGVKQPCTVLSCSKKGTPLNVSFMTAVWLDSAPDIHLLKERYAKIERQAEHP